MLQLLCQFRPPDEPHDEDDGTPSPLGGFPSEGEDLPYKVEVWDADGRYVEQVVAVSISPSIGYAAYYAATREYPGRSITLRHKGRIVSRWAGPAH
jgi:hypothetical protein